MNTNISKQIRAYLNKHLCRDYHNAYGELIEDPHYFMYEDEMGALIELVVKECCFTGEQYADGLIDSKYYAFVNKKIKQHFGVEE